MTIYEAIGIGEFLINIPISKDIILNNLQNSTLSKNSKQYFEVVNSVILRASIQRSNLELHVIEVSLNNAKYIQEISALIQSAIKYRILFIFIYNDRYLIARRSFQLTVSTDHVYSEHLSYATEWIYKENLISDILCNFQSEDVNNNSDDFFAFSTNYWKADDIHTDFYQVYNDILNNIGQLNQCMVESEVLSLRQFCDWFMGHSIKERLDIMPIIEAIISNYGMQLIDQTIFFNKNTIAYTVADIENSKYLRDIGRFGRHPFIYFDDLTLIDEKEIESEVLSFFYSNPKEINETLTNQNYEILISETVNNYFKIIGHYPVLSAEQEKNLLLQMQDGDNDAKELLIKSNLKMVVSLAKKYINRGLSLDDLIQEGTLGLISALEKYRISNDQRLYTYAQYHIRQAMQRAIFDMGYIIRLPVHMHERLYQIEKAEEKLFKNTGKKASYEEIANSIKISPKLVYEAKSLKKETIFFDDFSEDELEKMEDYFIVKDSASCYQWFRSRELKRTFENIFNGLTPREEEIIKLAFGFYEGRPRTLEEIGKHFDITRERIRQIEAKALRKLRHPRNTRCLRAFLDDEIDDNSENETISILPIDSSYSTPPYKSGFYISKKIEDINSADKIFLFNYSPEKSRISEEILKMEARIAEEQRKAEETRIAEEQRLAEEARIAEEQRKAEEARIAEEQRLAEEARIAEEQRLAEEALIAEEQRKAEEARIAEEQRLAEEARIAEEQRKAEEARIAEEQRKAEEARIAEEQRKAEEARIAEEQRLAEEARIVGEQRKAYEEKLEREMKAMQQAAELRLAADKQRAIEREKEKFRSQKVCQHCGGKFKGFFTKICSNCGKKKDY